MKIQAICIGTATRLPGKSYKTGIDKHPVGGPVIVDAEGLAGDAILNRKHHGGVDQAIYLEGSLTLNWWAEQLGEPYRPGLFGENLIIEGLDNREVAVGDRFRMKDVLLEVTSPRMPCATFAARMGDPRFVKRYRAAARPGIYCRVLKGGLVEVGEAVEYLPFTGEKVPVLEMMQRFGKPVPEEHRRRFLAAPIHYKLRDAILAEAMPG
jgi:MOSC domain-containing protein YiiM